MLRNEEKGNNDQTDQRPHKQGQREIDLLLGKLDTAQPVRQRRDRSALQERHSLQFAKP
jgi:hypothetical protein